MICNILSKATMIFSQKQADNYEENWPWKCYGGTKAPIKVACFGWIVIRESCLTQDNLQRRGFILSNRCYLCENGLESVNHLFIHCIIAKQCWELSLSRCGVTWIMPSDIRSLLVSWQGQKIARNQKQIWRTIPVMHILDHLERGKMVVLKTKRISSHSSSKSVFYWFKRCLEESIDQYMGFLRFARKNVTGCLFL